MPALSEQQCQPSCQRTLPASAPQEVSKAAIADIAGNKSGLLQSLDDERINTSYVVRLAAYLPIHYESPIVCVVFQQLWQGGHSSISDDNELIRIYEGHPLVPRPASSAASLSQLHTISCDLKQCCLNTHKLGLLTGAGCRCIIIKGPKIVCYAKTCNITHL